MGIGDDKLYAPEPAPRQGAQEGRPDGFGLRGDDLESQNLVSAVAVDDGGEDDGDRYHPPAAAGLQIGGSDRERRPSLSTGRPMKAYTRSSTERVDLPCT